MDIPMLFIFPERKLNKIITIHFQHDIPPTKRTLKTFGLINRILFTNRYECYIDTNYNLIYFI